MAYSVIKIYNLALTKLGARRLSAVDEDHPNARTITAVYEILRDAELRRYTWSFAIARASVAADGDGPTWGDWNRYSLPNDFLRLVRDDESGATVDWKREGLYILSRSASPLEFKYIARIEDPTYYDPLFVNALAGRIAFTCAKDIEDSTVSKESIQQDYKNDIAEAKRVGAIEKEAQEFPEDEWLQARR